MTLSARVFDHERYAMRAALSERKYFIVFVVLGVGTSILYMFLLPSLPSGGFSLYAINFIKPVQIAFALIFGILISLVIVLNVYAFRIRAGSSRKGLTAGSILASLVNGLCCTPLIPTLIAFSGASTPVLFEYSPRIQAFFEFNYPYFYLLSVALLLLSVHYLGKNISCCTRRN